MTTHKDQEIDRVRRQVCKTSDDLKDGGMPQCKIVTKIRHRMSPNKTLWDMLNDDAMKKDIHSLNEQMLKQDQTSSKLC